MPTDSRYRRQVNSAYSSSMHPDYIETGEIRLADYDPAWPVRFEMHRGIICAALGATVLCIEHIGSTCVPGLAAKPVVDILVVVAESVNESSYLHRLEAAEYVLRVREPDWNELREVEALPRAGRVAGHEYLRRCKDCCD